MESGYGIGAEYNEYTALGTAGMEAYDEMGQMGDDHATCMAYARSVLQLAPK